MFAWAHFVFSTLQLTPTRRGAVGGGAEFLPSCESCTVFSSVCTTVYLHQSILFACVAFLLHCAEVFRAGSFAAIFQKVGGVGKAEIPQKIDGILVLLGPEKDLRLQHDLRQVVVSSQVFRAGRFAARFQKAGGKKKEAVGVGRRQAEGSGRACRARLEGGSPFPLASPRVQKEGRRRGEGSGGACRARLGSGSPCPLASRLVQEEGRRRAEGSGGACRARLGGGSPCPLASPLVQEEGRRRLGAPPSRGLGRCLQSATMGRLVMLLSFRRWF